MWDGCVSNRRFQYNIVTNYEIPRYVFLPACTPFQTLTPDPTSEAVSTDVLLMRVVAIFDTHKHQEQNFSFT
jgi:hypothetical protein